MRASPLPRAAPAGRCGCGSACPRSGRSCSSMSPYPHFYQLALITPGTSPRSARSRSLLRPRPNLRYTPRGLPVSAQRLRRRTGEASRGSFCSLSRAASLASSVARESWITSSRAARRALNFSTVLRRFWSRSLSASLAMLGPSVLERETERGEQRARLVVRLRRGGNRDVHPAQRVDLVVIDLREDDLLLETEAVIAPAVKSAVRHAAEIADARHGDVHQAVEELVHPRAAQRHHAADGKAGANFEVCDRPARLGDHRLLPGDPGHVGERVVERLLVGGGLAHAHVERDLAQARHLHHGLVAELLHQLRHYFLAVVDRQARRRSRQLWRVGLRSGFFFRRGLFLLHRFLRLRRLVFLLGLFVLGHGFTRPPARRSP